VNTREVSEVTRTFKISLALAALIVAMLTALLAVPAKGETWKTVDGDDWCDTDGDTRLCEVREVTLAGRDDLSVTSVNGSIRVEAWDGDEIRVLARIQVKGDDAEETMGKVEILTDGGDIHATGPKKKGWSRFSGDRSWRVSYRVMVPADIELDVKTTNGGIEISGVNGDIEFKTTNGGVKVIDAGGDVEGSTTNGGVYVGLAPEDWDGDMVDLQTTNGGIEVELPEEINARIEARTTNGGVRVAHPVTIENSSRTRLNGTIGDGGKVLLRARTTNGGVSFTRASV